MVISNTRPAAVGEDTPVFDIMSTMRSMRRLAPDPVPDELLLRVVEAATWAPTGGNGQGYRFLVVTDREQIGRIAELWRTTVDWYLDTVGSVTPAGMTDDAYDRMKAAIVYQRDNFASTPALIVPCYDMRVVMDPARRAGLAAVRRTLALGPRLLVSMGGNPRVLRDGVTASIYPAVQNLLLAARSLGLGATLTIWHLSFEHEYKRVLGVPRHVRTYGIIPIGWPLGRLGPVSRPPAATVVHRDHWGGSWD